MKLLYFWFFWDTIYKNLAVPLIHVLVSEQRCQELEEKLASVEELLKAKTEESEEGAKRLEELHAASAENRQKLLEQEQGIERYERAVEQGGAF